METKEIVGRDREIETLVKEMKKGRSCLLIGDIGTGKSTILRQAYSQITKETKIKCLYILKSWPLKDMLYFIMEEMHERYHDLLPLPKEETKGLLPWKSLRKDAYRMKINEMASHISQSLKEKDYIIILDQLDRVTPSSVAVLEMLMDRCCVISATSMIKPNPALKRLYWKFKKITVNNLDRGDALKLIDQIIYDLDIPVEDPKMLKNKLLRASRGNPMMIRDVLESGALDQFVSQSFAREIDQLEHAGTKYIDLTPMLLVIGAVAMTIRFVALGIGSKDLYVFAGAGTAFFMVVRFFVYRTMRR